MYQFQSLWTEHMDIGRDFWTGYSFWIEHIDIGWHWWTLDTFEDPNWAYWAGHTMYCVLKQCNVDNNEMVQYLMWKVQAFKECKRQIWQKICSHNNNRHVQTWPISGWEMPWLYCVLEQCDVDNYDMVQYWMWKVQAVKQNERLWTVL